MSHTWYFAYGSNMQSATLRGRRGIEYRRAVPVRAPGWRLVLDKPPLFPVGESFANIVREDGAEVLGVAFEVTGDDLAHIDLTEGVLVGNYARVEIAVAALMTASDGAPERAFTLTSDRRAPELRPSRRYMDLLVEGALEHGLPEDWLAFLRGIPTGVESELAGQLRPMIDESLRRLRR